MITTHNIYRFSQRENRLTVQLMLALETNKVSFLKRFLELCQINMLGNSLKSMVAKLQESEEESTPDAALIQSNDN